MAKNIFLVGFMGCGKSFVGKHLATQLNMQFVDIDQIIENTEGVSISQIFAEKGESFFRNLEHQTLRRYTDMQNFCIATGGGAPCFHNNMALMNEHGITIYLKTSPFLILERLQMAGELEKRPLLRGKTSDEILTFIQDKIQERSRFYEEAQIIIEQKNNNIEELLQQILFQIKSFF